MLSYSLGFIISIGFSCIQIVFIFVLLREKTYNNKNDKNDKFQIIGIIHIILIEWRI